MVFIEEIEDEIEPTPIEVKATDKPDDKPDEQLLTDEPYMPEIQHDGHYKIPEVKLAKDEEQYVDTEDMTVKVRKIERPNEESDNESDNMDDIEEETPVQFRTRIRAGNGKLVPTSGVCPGYQQANLAFVPDDQFDNFALFCKSNPGPLPVLHQSYEIGDYNAEPLTNDYADARTDCPGYNP